MQQATAIKVKSCKEMRGATSLMPVIKGACSQQAADTTQWADTIDWKARCDWLQVASVVTCSLQVLTFNFYLASLMVVMTVEHLLTLK